MSGTKQTMADAPTNAGLSTGSGHSLSSDLEESALQHLDVSQLRSRNTKTWNNCWLPLKVDYSNDNDSAIGGMTPQTSTMSVNSSIYHYVEENGRTYHRYKEGSALS